MVEPLPAVHPQFRFGSVDITVHRNDGGRHLMYICGALLNDAVPGLLELIAGELIHRPSPLTLDLSAVSRIDAGGAQLLEWAAALVAEHNIPLCLVGVTDLGPLMSTLVTFQLDGLVRGETPHFRQDLPRRRTNSDFPTEASA